ncbi:MAG: AAA family ATPase [Devosia indica]
MSLFDHEDDETELGPTKTPLKRKLDRSKTAYSLLPQVMLEIAIGTDFLAKLRGEKSLCLVVETRSDEWVMPIARYLHGNGDWDRWISKTSDDAKRRDDATGPAMMELLSAGGRVFGVADRFTRLPDGMVSAADLRIELPELTPEVVETVIRRMSRQRIAVPKAVTQLSFNDLASCLRVGDSAKDNLARLERAAAQVRTVTPYSDDVPHIRDLHGYGAAKDWAMALIEDVEAWRRGEIEFDAIAARNVVLSSAPGLGKSSFAKSLAKSLGIPLVATSVGAWFANGPGYLDSVIKQIDQVFASASAVAPAVLLLDEIDALPSRSTLSPRAADWWLPVITHLLTTLDSAVSGVADKLFIVGASNYGDRLDEALVRPGRLDSIIRIGPPDAQALSGIMRQHLGSDLAGEDLSEAANLAFGATGANVVVWVRAARRIARNARRPMMMTDLLLAIAPPDHREADMVERIALHESGHAVACLALGLGKVLSVSIVASGDKGGVTITDFDGRIPTRPIAEKVAMQALAGRAAEEHFLGEPGTGAGGTSSSDLAHATRTIGLLHLGAGLGEDLTFRADQENVHAVLAVNRRHAEAVEADLRLIYQRSLALIGENAPLVRAVADALISRRHLGPAGFLDIVEKSRSIRKEPDHG